MANKFNRQIIFNLRAFDERKQTIAISSFFRTKIDVSLSKDIYASNHNNGSVTLINASRTQANKVFASIKRRYGLLYTLQAGYSEGFEIEDIAEGLPILSIGFISNSNWRHAGGDTFVDFQITEGIKADVTLLSNQDFGVRQISVPTIAKGAGLGTLFIQVEEDFRNNNFEIEYLPDKQTILNELNNIKSPKTYVVTDLESTMKNILETAQMSFYIENRKMIIYRNRSGFNFLSSPSGKFLKLNFNTGLLSADVEITRHPRAGIITPILKFKALYSPDIRPNSILAINEEQVYPDLVGTYVVQNVSYSLTNKDGGEFTVQGTALKANLAADGKTLITFSEQLREVVNADASVIQNLQNQGFL